MSTTVAKAPAGGLSDDAHAKRVDEIRRMALAAIATKDKVFPAKKYQHELRRIGRRENWFDFQEAMISLSILQRIMPKRTLSRLNELRQARVEQDQSHVFDSYLDHLKKHLAPGSLTRHGYPKLTLADRDHSALWNGVNAYISIFSDLGYDAFLDSGTLLGVTRDRKFLDHDDDIDLALVLNATSEKEAAQEWMALREKLVEQGIFLDDQGDNPKPDYYKLKAIAGVAVDLFPAWSVGNQMYVYPHTYGELSQEDVLPLKPCDVTGLPVPAKPEAMLAVNYGKDWENPDPLFRFPWTRASRIFRGFTEELS